MEKYITKILQEPSSTENSNEYYYIYIYYYEIFTIIDETNHFIPFHKQKVCLRSDIQVFLAYIYFLIKDKIF